MEPFEVKQLLQQAGLHASKDRGQNFLLDESVIDEMITTADVQADDVVVEVGPGLGILTSALSKKAKAVFAIELDHGLVRHLQAEFLPKHPNVTLFAGDALSSETYFALRSWLKEQKADAPGAYKVVANLPYSITSRILRYFTEMEPRPRSATVMVQKEVAQRAVAKPGDMSLLALMLQTQSEVSIAREVSAELFYPQPEVDSAVLHIDLSRPNPAYSALTDDQKKRFWRLAKRGFSSKRKQLKNNVPDEVENLEKAGIGAQARAQELSVAQWALLATY